MTVKLSPHKISRILRYYFSGVPQPAIARRVGVDQSTVSLYSSRFKESAIEVGLLGAGKEFRVLNEVESLRSLSVELYKSKLTVEEAKYGVKIMEIFVRLGIDPDQHIMVIEVCKKVDDPGFINAALKLNRIEAVGQISYEEVISKFERITSELPLAEKKLKEMKAEQESLKNVVAQKKQEITKRQSQLAQLQEETITKKAKYNEELEAEMKQLSVKRQEVKEVAKLKGEMAKRGLNISTLMQVAEEFKL